MDRFIAHYELRQYKTTHIISVLGLHIECLLHKKRNLLFFFCFSKYIICNGYENVSFSNQIIIYSDREFIKFEQMLLYFSC